MTATAPVLAIDIGARLLGSSVGAMVVVNLLPFPYSFVFLIIPFLFGLWTFFKVLASPHFLRVALGSNIWADPWVIAVALVCVAIVVGFARSSDAFASLTYFEFAAGVGCLALAAMASAVFASGGNRRLAIESCLIVVCVSSTLIGATSLYKYYLLEAGRTFPLIGVDLFGEYPWGTSLRRDYNLFSISFLLASLAVFWYTLVQSSIKVHSFGALAALAGLFAFIGINSGSRRFTILIGLVFIAAFIIAMIGASGRRLATFQRSVVLASSAAAVALSLSYSIHALVQNSAVAATVDQGRSDRGGGVVEGSSTSDPLKSTDEVTSTQDLQEKDTGVQLQLQARLQTIVDGTATGTRSLYWRGGLRLLEEGDAVFGDGFDYQKKLSCMINKCVGFDHPHNFLISHWLSAGIFGLAAAASLLLALLAVVLRSLWSGDSFERVVAVAILTLCPYSFISGDTIFALPALSVLPALLIRPVCRKTAQA